MKSLMKNQTMEASAYKKIVEEIVLLYENARESLTLFYWGTGKRIVEVEQNGKTRAPYGKGLLNALSADLTRRLGSGFSERNLERMRGYYLASSKSPTSSKLVWSRKVELLSIKDKKKKLAIEEKAMRQDLTSRQIRALVRKERGLKTRPPKTAGLELPPLKRPTDLRLYTYKKADVLPEADEFGMGSGGWIDCGFFLTRRVPKLAIAGVTLTDKPAYTYAAFVERIVDGDTLIAVIHAGFGNVFKWRLRLRGIDCPERSTAKGKEAKRYVEKLLPRGTRLVVKSSKTDLHGRFVADVFFGQGLAAGFEEIASGANVWLNQHLLDQGLAVRQDA